MRHNQVTVPTEVDGMVLVKGVDVFTGVEHITGPMSEARLARWVNREITIQEALPDVKSDDREFLITGLVVSEHPDLYKELE